MRLFQAGLAVLALFTTILSARPNTDMSYKHLHRQNHRSLQSRASNRLVFAHIIVGIVGGRGSSSAWDADMQRAKAIGIDAFALNIGVDSFTDQQLQYAYQSAANNGMKVFISFDFNWWSTGSATAVGQKIAQYASLPAQLMVDGKVFVSSFIGDGLDVTALRNAVGRSIYFAPNFHPTYGTSLASLDSAFNWMGWPNNGNNRAPSPGQTNTVQLGDQQYISALNGKDYLAPASPWFFTHYGPEVSYSKNWLFPGDTLWFDRWTQLLALGPRFIEIVSWNDYGESHYVGPLSSPHTDDGASKWVNDMPHDAWLDMAKPYIAAYKAGATSVNNYITSDQLFYWYRPQPKTVNCDATDTCMSGSAYGDYYIGKPNGYETVTDSVFVVSLLRSAGTVQITSGGNTQSFSAPAGATIFTVPMGIGQQSFALIRNSQTVFSGTSLKNIINGCVCGLYNFNAYVGSLPAGNSPALGPDGFSNFSNGLRVSTCSATPSLGSTAPTTSSVASTSSTSASTSSTPRALSSSITTPTRNTSTSSAYPPNRPTTTSSSYPPNRATKTV